MRILRRVSHTTMDEEGLLQDEEGLPTLPWTRRVSCKTRRGSHTTMDEEGLPTLYTMDKNGLSHGCD